ncbi:PPE domain-containing protein [Prescottella defluvii]|uniref:hypothetical protein n=1 Tax=Prescottella defluvii TaxID=1323361 RepID=UPI0004F2C788|nr:hypothetical protein [Prescottella defluvii]
MIPSDPTAPGNDQPTVLDLLQASPVAPVLDMPVPRTPMEALAASPIGPLLETPFTDIAAGALPPMPPMPALPPLPPLPGLDQLLQPISELAGAFGTGAVGGLDPTAMLQQSSSSIDTALSVGLSALKTLDQVWEGQAALAAQSRGRQAYVAGEQLSVRGNEIAAVTQEAAGSVARGNAKLLAVVESFVATAVSAAPVALTPPGQTMLIAAAADHLQRALTVVAETRAELAGHQSAMAALGAEVPVPAAPAPAAGLMSGSGPSPIAIAGSLLESVGRPVAGNVPRQIGDYAAAPTLAAGISGDFAPAATPPTTAFGAGGSAGAGGAFGSAASGFLGGIGGGGAAAAGSAARGPSSAPSPVVGAPTAGPVGPAAAAAGTATSGGFAPGAMTSGASGARSGYDDSVDRDTPGYLVDAVRGDGIVGDLPMVAPAVIGGIDPADLGVDEFDRF